jgi:hypothetical protein
MTKGQLTVSALALAFASSLLAYPTLAQNTAKSPNPGASAPAAAAKQGDQAILKFSQDGNNAIREVNGARVAIFDGHPKLATVLLTKAKASVAKAAEEAPTFKVKVTTSVAGKDVNTASETDKAELVPVDGQLMLADDFVSTPEKQTRIKNANVHFKNGKNKEALEELRLGAIEVMYNRVWMPIDSTSKHIDQAMKLMDDQKYYEANLALKAITDSLTVDSIKLTDVPKAKS